MMLDDIFTPANRAVVGLLRSPLGALAGSALMVIEYVGRSSGNTFTLPVGYQRDGDVIVTLVSKPHDKGWWKNFREPWPAELLVRRERHDATGQVIVPERDAFFEHIEGTLQQMPWMGSQFGGIKYRRSAGLSDDQRAILVDHAAVVEFTVER